MTQPIDPSRASQPHLPRFSHPKDIDEFVAKLDAYEKGEIGPEQFRAFRLTRGVYGQRQDDFQMIRVKIPAGLVGQEQLDALAEIAERYARGIGHITTRQNVQFHFVQMADAETAMRRLDEAGLTTRDACGNTARTVTACETAQVCATAPFDVTPYAEAVTRYFLRHPLSGGLPRKFKTAFSGCANDCARAAINDLGYIAEVRDGVRGFKVVCAGGLSTSPRNAIVLHEWVPAAELNRVGEAILRLFNELGNRENKARARLKYVLKKLGEDGFREAYARIRAEVDAEAVDELKLPEAFTNTPAPAVTSLLPPAAGYLAWRAASVVDQRQDGYSAVYVRLFLGDLTADQMRALGRTITRFGDGTARITLDQNILLPWVDKRSLPALHRELESHGLAGLGIHTAHDVLSCPGASSCALAVTASRSLAGAISERLAEPDARDLAAVAGTQIKISGCPNSCGQHHVADLGFHGGARHVGDITIPTYQLHLGGGVDERGARFGRQVVKLTARRVPEAVVLLMRLFERERREAETPGSFFERVDPRLVTTELASLMGPPTDVDRTDIGETEGFLVLTKEGECAA